jgi:preprotein translocase subunit YajC
MTAPDYVFPVVGYRVWQWDATGLKSLNGIRWHPGSAFAAECKSQGCYEVPRTDCTCGIYASKTLDHLRRLGYLDNRIHGEVSLWGNVVEHEEGWRAQFAYPRSFTVPLSLVPLGMSNVEPWLTALSAYGCDIFIEGESGTVPLWRTGSGVEASGFELLMQRCNVWYARRAQERRIKRGDRVAVIGYGIAIVEHADSHHVQAVLGNRNVLRIERKEIVWYQQNNRWETAVGAVIKSSNA